MKIIDRNETMEFILDEDDLKRAIRQYIESEAALTPQPELTAVSLVKYELNTGFKEGIGLLITNCKCIGIKRAEKCNHFDEEYQKQYLTGTCPLCGERL